MFSSFPVVPDGNESQHSEVDDHGDDEMPELECLDDTSSDGAFTDDSEDEQKDEHGDERPPFVTDGRGRVIGAADRVDHVMTSFQS